MNFHYFYRNNGRHSAEQSLLKERHLLSLSSAERSHVLSRELEAYSGKGEEVSCGCEIGVISHESGRFDVEEGEITHDLEVDVEVRNHLNSDRRYQFQNSVETR